MLNLNFLFDSAPTFAAVMWLKKSALAMLLSIIALIPASMAQDTALQRQLLFELDTSKADTFKIEALLKLAASNERVNDSIALKQLTEAYDRAKAYGYTKVFVTINQRLGEFYYRVDKPFHAYRSLIAALECAQGLGDTNLVVESYTNIAQLCYQYFQDSVALKNMVNANNLAQSGHHTDAQLKLKTKSKLNQLMVALAFRYEKAPNWLNIHAALPKYIDSNSVYVQLDSIKMAYRLLKWDGAKSWLAWANYISNEDSTISGDQKIDIELWNWYLNFNEDSAINYQSLALKYDTLSYAFAQTQYFVFLTNMVRYTKRVRDFDLAISYTQRYYDYMSEQVQVKQMRELEWLRDQQIVQRTELFKTTNNTVQQAEDLIAKKDKTIIRLWILAGILALVTGLFAYRKQSRKQKEKAELEQIRQEIEKQEQFIASQKANIGELSVIKDNLYSAINNDIRKPVSTLKNLVSMVNIPDLSKEEILTILSGLSQEIDEISEHSENIVTWTVAQKEGFSPNIQKHQLIQLIVENLKGYRTKAKLMQIEFKIESEEEIVCKTDPKLFGLVIRNLVSYALTRAPIQTDIAIKCSANNSRIWIDVEDNGKQLDADQQREILSQRKLTQRGFNYEKSTGFGMLLSQEILIALSGKLEYHEHPTGGNIYRIILRKL